jgi:DNA-binding transcriptional ArsR family regulator
LQFMKGPAPALSPIFRSDTQGRLLAALVAEPNREFSLADLAERADTSPATSGREIDRLEAAGIVRSRRVGNTRMVSIETTARLYQPLSEIVTATWGVPAIIAQEFGSLPGAQGVFIFGSWAARRHGEPGHQPNDIDVLVLGHPDRDQVDDAAERAERRIRLPVQATVRSADGWTEPSDPLGESIRNRPLYEVIPLHTDEGGRS